MRKPKYRWVQRKVEIVYCDYCGKECKKDFTYLDTGKHGYAGQVVHYDCLDKYFKKHKLKTFGISVYEDIDYVYAQTLKQAIKYFSKYGEAENVHEIKD